MFGILYRSLSKRSPVNNTILTPFRSYTTPLSSTMTAWTSSTTNGHADKPKEVLLIGLGSVGSVYAYILERAGKARVTAVARSNYEQYKNKGVTLDTERFGKHEHWRPHRVVKSQAEALEGDVHYDFALITTKALPDVSPTSKLVKEAIKSGKVGAWALIQNGLDVEVDLLHAVKHLDTPIISGVAYIGVMTSPDGAVVTWRGSETLVSGIYPPLAPVDQPQERQFSQKELAALKSWEDILKAGEANLFIEDRIDSVRYAKNVVNAGWSSIQGLVRGPAVTFEHFKPEQLAPLKAFVREIVDIGFKSGLLKEGQTSYPARDKIVDPATLAERNWSFVLKGSIEKSKQGIPPHKMSLLIDVEQGRPFEVEVITGAPLRLAQKNKLDTPLLALTYALLKGLQVNIVKARGLQLVEVDDSI